jgi:hypothetical protein
MEKEKEYWYYIVRHDYVDRVGDNPNYFKHDVKEEALHRATKYMMISIENLCTDYKMGKPLVGLHNIIYRLCYAESLDCGITYTEEVLEEKKLADYLGNHSPANQKVRPFYPWEGSPDGQD